MYGNGVAKYSDGTHAEGWWEGGHLLKGSLNKPAEGEYSGEFEDGRFHGHGCMNYANGSSYVGEWKMGRRAAGSIVNRAGVKTENVVKAARSDAVAPTTVGPSEERL